jgi:hypothetical protein
VDARDAAAVGELASDESAMARRLTLSIDGG